MMMVVMMIVMVILERDLLVLELNDNWVLLLLLWLPACIHGRRCLIWKVSLIKCGVYAIEEHGAVSLAAVVSLGESLLVVWTVRLLLLQAIIWHLMWKCLPF